MRVTQRPVTLPIGRTARLSFELDALRADCCRSAQAIVNRKKFEEAELDECARLDEALAQAHRQLKAAVRDIMLSRLRRRSRKSRTR